MIKIKDYSANEEKNDKIFVELIDDHYRNYLLLSPNELNLLNFIREEGYLDSKCSVNIIYEGDIKEF